MALGPAELEIAIKTRADLKGARDLEASLKAQIASLKKLGQDASAAEAQLKKVQASIKAAPVKSSIFQQAADGLRRIKEQGGAASTAITGFAGLITAPMAAVGAVVGAVTLAFGGLIRAVHEFAESDDAVVALDAALAQNQLLTEETRTKYQELASQLQETTKVADETWLRVMAQLTLYGSKPESIGMDIEAVKSLAALLGGGESGIVGAANLWSKALNGNFTWLRRYNIVLDDSIPKHEKLRALQLELAGRAGGQLEERAKSLGGQLAEFKLKASDLLEELGRLTAHILGPLFYANNKLNESVTWVLAGINSWFDSSSKLRNANKATTQTTEEATDAVDKYALKLEAALKAIQALQRTQDELADADLAARIAVVNSDETRGKLSKEEAIRLRYGLRQQSAGAKLENSVSANAASIRTLYGRLPGLDAAGKVDEMQAIRMQIRELDSANQQALRLRSAGRFTEGLGAADEVYRARKDAAGPGGSVDMRAGFDLLGKTIEESLDSLVARIREKTKRLEDQISNGPNR